MYGSGQSGLVKLQSLGSSAVNLLAETRMQRNDNELFLVSALWHNSNRNKSGKSLDRDPRSLPLRITGSRLVVVELIEVELPKVPLALISKPPMRETRCGR